RIVAEETTREFSRDKMCRRWLSRQNIEYALAVSHAAAGGNLSAEHNLLAIIMQAGTIKKQPFFIRLLNRPTRKAARDFLHVFLGIAAVHAQRMQLHQLA